MVIIDIILEHALSWWGILAIVLAAGGYAVYDYEAFRAKVVNLIFIAEEKAREKCLETGRDKMDWVIQNGYPYLPAWLKLFISDSAFRVLIQAIFDGLVDWAEKNKHR